MLTVLWMSMIKNPFDYLSTESIRIGISNALNMSELHVPKIDGFFSREFATECPCGFWIKCINCLQLFGKCSVCVILKCTNVRLFMLTHKCNRPVSKLWRKRLLNNKKQHIFLENMDASSSLIVFLYTVLRFFPRATSSTPHKLHSINDVLCFFGNLFIWMWCAQVASDIWFVALFCRLNSIKKRNGN